MSQRFGFAISPPMEAPLGDERPGKAPTADQTNQQTGDSTQSPGSMVGFRPEQEHYISTSFSLCFSFFL